MNNRIKKVGMGGFLVLVLAAGLVLWLVKPGALPAIKLPEPNGYTDIVKAGQLLTGESPDVNPSPTAEQYRAYVLTNQEALRLVRVGLSRECLIPVQNSQSYLETHLPELGKIKALAQLLRGEGKVAELEGRPRDAANSYLDIIRLGNKATRGGFVIDSLVGVACEAIGLNSLRPTVRRLEAQQCREAIQALELIDAQREDWLEICRRDKRLGRRSLGWRWLLAELVTFNSNKQSMQKAEQKRLTQVTALREVEIDLAARAFEKDKGHPPETLAELTPAYLKSIPQNPNTGAPLTYRP